MSVKHIHTTDPSACWTGFVFVVVGGGGQLVGMFPYPEGVRKTSRVRKNCSGHGMLTIFLQIQWTVQGWVLSKADPVQDSCVSCGVYGSHAWLWCSMPSCKSFLRIERTQCLESAWASPLSLGLIVFPHPSPNHVEAHVEDLMSKETDSKWHGLNMSVCVFPFCCLAYNVRMQIEFAWTNKLFKVMLSASENQQNEKQTKKIHLAATEMHWSRQPHLCFMYPVSLSKLHWLMWACSNHLPKH